MELRTDVVAAGEESLRERKTGETAKPWSLLGRLSPSIPIRTWWVEGLG